MITDKTALILGAGTSAPFGFPSGAELKKTICDDFLQKGEMFKQFKEWWNTNDDEMTEFANTLKHSGQYSVDAFLERQTNYIDIGKKAMAYALIKKESQCKPLMFQLDCRFNNWYQYLFSRLDSGLDTFSENELSIITFNYDRSLGYYLLTALSNSYSRPKIDIVNAFQSITLIHLHGQLGPYDSAGLPDHVEPRRVDVASNEIFVVHESVDEHPTFQRAREILQSAKRIAFLGFGYNERNVKRLRLRNLGGEKELFGSCYGLTEMERQQAGLLINPDNPKSVKFGDNNQTTYEFLRSNPILV